MRGLVVGENQGRHKNTQFPAVKFLEGLFVYEAFCM